MKKRLLISSIYLVILIFFVIPIHANDSIYNEMNKCYSTITISDSNLQYGLSSKPDGWGIPRNLYDVDNCLRTMRINISTYNSKKYHIYSGFIIDACGVILLLLSTTIKPETETAALAAGENGKNSLKTKCIGAGILSLAVGVPITLWGYNNQNNEKEAITAMKMYYRENYIEKK